MEVYSAPFHVNDLDIEMKSSLLLATCVTVVTAPAFADWHGSQWGMAYNELAVSGVPVFWPLSAEEVTRNSNQYDGETVFGFRMEMKQNQGYFLFKDGKLSAIRFEIGDFKLTEIMKKKFFKEQGNQYIDRSTFWDRVRAATKATRGMIFSTTIR